MKSLMTFAGILAFNFLNTAYSAEFSCPISQAVSQYTCSGTLRVQSMVQLMAYKSNLGTTTTNPTVAKDLLIDFNMDLNEDLNISSPCAIKTTTNITINSTANICLNGKNAVVLEEGLTFTGKNLKLEGNEQVFIGKNSNIIAQNISLLSKGNGDLNQAYIRDNATINAANITIESLNKGFIGANSNLHLTGTFAVYSKGDADATVRGSARIEAAKIDIQSSNITTIANLATMIAPEIKLIGTNGCNVSKGASITATDRIGNCFLTSLTQQKFSIDKNRGNAPLTVSFNASTITDNVTAYLWTFGDGQTLTTTVPTVNHTYAAAGSYTASLMFATLPNEKGQKSAGELRIDVQAAPVVPTTPPRGTFNYAQDGTFVYLKAFIRRTQFDIAKAYYVIDGNQNNKINIDNFYQNAQTTVEMSTFGIHNVVMYVEDTAGQKFNTALSIDLKQDENQIAPFIRFYGEQSAVRTAFINMTQSFIPIPNEYIKDFKVEFGDGQVAMIEGATSVVHTYAQAGTYNVKVSGTYNGITRSNTQAVTVTNNNLPALNPVAAFEYLSFDFAGNVRFTDNRSATPNGEIISFEWDFGDGLGLDYGSNVSRFFEPGVYIVSLKVTDSLGKTNIQTQKIHIVESGDSLIAALNCWQEGLKFLGCNIFALDQQKQISRIKVEWGDNTSSILSDAEIEAWGLFFDEHEYENYGIYNIKLTVETIRGLSKKSYYTHNFNNPNPETLNPLAVINCSQIFNTITCDSFSSISPNGAIVNSYWDFGDGATAMGAVVTHNYQSTGQYILKLNIQDSSNKYSQTVKVVNVIGSAPVALASCNVERQTLSCSASQSYSVQGNLIEYRWIIDGENDQYGENINYKLTTSGQKNIKLYVKSSNGLVSNKDVGSFNVLNSSPVASFSCDTTNQSKVKCFAGLSNDYGSLIEYRWDINGNVYYGQDQVFSFNSDGDYTISLMVKDNMNSINQKSVEYTLEPSKEWNNSNGTIKTLQDRETLFYPLNGDIKFKIENAKLNQAVIRNKIYINEILLDSNNIDYDFYNNTITIHSELVDGANELRFEIYDEFNKLIESQIFLLAGSRTVSVQLKNINNFDNFNLQVFFLSNTAPIQIPVIDSDFVLENVPEIIMFFKVIGSNSVGSNILFVSNEILEVNMNSISDIKNDLNYGFENGVEGWNLGQSLYEIRDKGLILSTNNSGEAIISKTMIAGENSGAITFNQKILSVSSKDYYYLLLKNKTTGQSIEEFIHVSSLSDFSDNNAHELSNLIISKTINVSSSNDVIEMELKLYRNQEISTSSTVFKNFLNILISSANAFDSGRFEVFIPGLDKDAQIVDVRLFTANYLPMGLISLGKYPTYENGGMVNPDNLIEDDSGVYVYNYSALRSTNTFYARISTKGLLSKNIKKLKLKIYNSPDQIPSRIVEIPSFNYKKTNDFIEAKIIITDKYENISTIPNNVRMRIEVQTLDGIILERDIENKLDLERQSYKYNLSGYNFRTLVSMKANYDLNQRFSYRDLSEGGDDWVRPMGIEQIYSLGGTISGNDKSMLINDISYMNGGVAPPHKSHSLGLSVDARNEEYRIDGLDGQINSRENAKQVINILNSEKFLKNTELVYVTYQNNSPFEQEISQTCLASGRMANEVIEYRKDHYKHFHIEMDFGENSSLKPRGLRPFYIANEVNVAESSYYIKPGVDYNSFELQPKGASLAIKKLTHYLLIKKVDTSESSWVKIEVTDDSNFVIPDSLRDSELDIKVIYRGQGAKRCETSVMYADFRKNLNEYNCFDNNEYGTYFSYLRSPDINQTIIRNSVFVGKKTLEQSPNLGSSLLAQNFYSSGDESQISKSAICGNSKLSKVSYIKNFKIIDSEVLGVPAHISNSVVTRSKIIDSVSNNLNTAFVDSVIFESDIENGAIVVKSNVTKSKLDHSNLYNVSVKNNSFVSDSNIGVPEIASTIDNSSVINYSYILGNFKDSSISGSSVNLSSANLANIINSKVKVDNNISNATIKNTMVETGSITGSTLNLSWVIATNVSNSSIENTYVTSEQNISGGNYSHVIANLFNGWNGALSYVDCQVYPAPPSNEPGYKIDQYCKSSNGYLGYFPAPPADPDIDYNESIARGVDYESNN